MTTLIANAGGLDNFDMFFSQFGPPSLRYGRFDIARNQNDASINPVGLKSVGGSACFFNVFLSAKRHKDTSSNYSIGDHKAYQTKCI
jgi:hypothetical protein